jgi:hypothetical protein
MDKNKKMSITYLNWLSHKETHRKCCEIFKRWGMEIPDILPYIRQADLDNWIFMVESRNL